MTLQYQHPFYITLPSDACSDLYSDNTASAWKTKLYRAISLSGKWEVALVELLYPNSMYNIPSDQYLECLQNWGPVGQTISVSMEVSAGTLHTEIKRLKIHAGSYTIDQLIEKLTKQIPKLKNVQGEDTTQPAFTIKMLPHTQTIEVKIASARVVLDFRKHGDLLRRIFGFHATVLCSTLTHNVRELLGASEDAHLILNQKAYLQVKDDTAAVAAHILGKGDSFTSVHVGDEGANARIGNQSFFIYTDIVDFSLVGDTFTQILRTVPIREDSAFQLITDRFEIPHYIPLLKQIFDVIEISIATDLGENARFALSKSMVKLHFRPQRF